MLTTRNRMVGFFLFIFAIFYLYLSFQLPPYHMVPVDSDVIPIVLGFLLLILSVVLFFTKETEQESEKQKRILPEDKKDIFMLLIVASFILIYIWLLEVAGFIITSILFIFFTTIVLGYKRHVVNLIVSISIPVVFYYLFSNLLGIGLPSGFLPF